MIKPKPAKRIPVAVSSEQADLMHELNKTLNDAFEGKMGISDLEKGRKNLARLWDIYAQQRVDIGLSKGMKP